MSHTVLLNSAGLLDINAVKYLCVIGGDSTNIIATVDKFTHILAVGTAFPCYSRNIYM